MPTQDGSILEIYDERALEAASPQVKSDVRDQGHGGPGRG
jgi:hypothetical protein